MTLGARLIRVSQNDWSRGRRLLWIDELLSLIPESEADAKLATRAAGSNVLQMIAAARPG